MGLCLKGHRKENRPFWGSPPDFDTHPPQKKTSKRSQIVWYSSPRPLRDPVQHERQTQRCPQRPSSTGFALPNGEAGAAGLNPTLPIIADRRSSVLLKRPAHFYDWIKRVVELEVRIRVPFFLSRVPNPPNQKRGEKGHLAGRISLEIIMAGNGDKMDIKSG